MGAGTHFECCFYLGAGTLQCFLSEYSIRGAGTQEVEHLRCL